MIPETLNKRHPIDIKRLMVPESKSDAFRLNTGDFAAIDRELSKDQRRDRLADSSYKFADAKILYDQQNRKFSVPEILIEDIIGLLKEDKTAKWLWQLTNQLSALCILSPGDAMPFRQNDQFKQSIEMYLKYKQQKIDLLDNVRTTAMVKIIYPNMTPKDLFVPESIWDDTDMLAKDFFIKDEDIFNSNVFILSNLRIIDSERFGGVHIPRESWQKAQSYLNKLRTKNHIVTFLSTAHALAMLAAPNLTVTDRGIVFAQETFSAHRQKPLPVERNF